MFQAIFERIIRNDTNIKKCFFGFVFWVCFFGFFFWFCFWVCFLGLFFGFVFGFVFWVCFWAVFVFCLGPFSCFCFYISAAEPGRTNLTVDSPFSSTSKTPYLAHNSDSSSVSNLHPAWTNGLSTPAILSSRCSP